MWRTLFASICSSSSSGAKVASTFQVNAFYGQASGVSPESINKKINDLDVGATKQTPKIKSTVLLGGEFMSQVKPSILIGVRYTVQRADSTQGTSSTGVNQVMIEFQDVSGVAKYNFTQFGFNFNVGAAVGTSVVNDLIINDAGSRIRYSSPGGLVARGFVGLRMQWSLLALWGEAGYQNITDKAYKSDQGGKPTSTAGDVTLNLSGPYALGGLGLQF